MKMIPNLAQGERRFRVLWWRFRNLKIKLRLGNGFGLKNQVNHTPTLAKTHERSGRRKSHALIFSKQSFLYYK